MIYIVYLRYTNQKKKENTCLITLIIQFLNCQKYKQNATLSMLYTNCNKLTLTISRTPVYCLQFK